MNFTPIHLSKKLEKILKKHIQKEAPAEPGILGSWNATVFYVQRQKCLMITNSPSRYTVLLPGFAAKDAPNFSKHFLDALFTQLTYDGIIMNIKEVEELTGEVLLLPTNNNRPIIGTQNYNIGIFENYWNNEFGSLENMPVNDLANRLNKTIFNPGKGQQLTSPVKEFAIQLESIH